MLNVDALKGIYRYHEFIGPVILPEAVVYLGEGQRPFVPLELRGDREESTRKTARKQELTPA